MRILVSAPNAQGRILALHPMGDEIAHLRPVWPRESHPPKTGGIQISAPWSNETSTIAEGTAPIPATSMSDGVVTSLRLGPSSRGGQGTEQDLAITAK